MIFRKCPGLILISANEHFAIRPIPRRDLVPPPELARDAPGLDVAHPLKIRLLPVLRHEDRVAVLHRLDCRLGERLRIGKPLVGEHRLDDVIGPVAKWLHDALVLDLDHQAIGIDIRDDTLSRFQPVKTTIFIRNKVDAVDMVFILFAALLHDLHRLSRSVGIRRSIGAHLGLLIHQAILGDVIALRDRIVVEIVSPGDLHRT